MVQIMECFKEQEKTKKTQRERHAWESISNKAALKFKETEGKSPFHSMLNVWSSSSVSTIWTAWRENAIRSKLTYFRLAENGIDTQADIKHSIHTYFYTFTDKQTIKGVGVGTLNWQFLKMYNDILLPCKAYFSDFNRLLLWLWL